MSFTPSLSHLKKNWLTVFALHFETVHTAGAGVDEHLPVVCALHFLVIDARARCVRQLAREHTTLCVPYILRPFTSHERALTVYALHQPVVSRGMILTSYEALTECPSPRLDAAQPARIFLFSFISISPIEAAVPRGSPRVLSY